MTKYIRTFSFNWLKDDVAHALDDAILKSPFIITQKELEYFLSLSRVLYLTKEYVKQKFNFNLKLFMSFGYTIELFLEEIKKYSWYKASDETLSQLVTMWPVSGSVLCDFYKKHQVQQRGKKLKKKKPTRKQRFFPVMRNTELFVLEQRIKEHRAKLRNAVLKYCQAKRKLKKKVESEKKKNKDNQEDVDDKEIYLEDVEEKPKKQTNNQPDIFIESTEDDNGEGISSPISQHEEENNFLRFEPISKKSSFAMIDDVSEWNGRREKEFTWY